MNSFSVSTPQCSRGRPSSSVSRQVDLVRAHLYGHCPPRQSVCCPHRTPPHRLRLHALLGRCHTGNRPVATQAPPHRLWSHDRRNAATQAMDRSSHRKTPHRLDPTSPHASLQPISRHTGAATQALITRPSERCHTGHGSIFPSEDATQARSDVPPRRRCVRSVATQAPPHRL
jgi:hypothetical protein